MLERPVGSNVLLNLVLEDGDTTRFPRAFVYTNAGVLVDTVDLTHVADGLYQGTTAFAFTVGEYGAIFVTYTDAGHTTLSDHARAEETILIVDTLSDQVWDEDLATHLTLGSAGLAAVLNHYHGAVHIDTASGTPGTAYPLGTEEQPVDNLADAIIIANSFAIRRFHIRGSVTLTSALPDWTFVGDGEEADVKLNGQDVADSEFFNIFVSGTLGNGPITCTNCNIQDIDDFEGTAIECSIETGEITLVGDASFIRCNSAVPGLSTPIFNMNGTGYNMEFRAYSGGIDIRGLTGAGDNISVDMIAGQVILDSSNTAGNIVLRGIGDLTDNSAGSTVKHTAFLPNLLTVSDAVADAVWDEAKADHTLAGSTGEALIATAGHAGLYGLLDGGAGFPNIPHNANNNLTSARLRIFKDQTDLDNATLGAADDADSEILRLNVDLAAYAAGSLTAVPEVLTSIKRGST